MPCLELPPPGVCAALRRCNSDCVGKRKLKKFIVSLFALTTIASLSHAGPVESSAKETQQTAVPQIQDWYSDREWNFDLFGSYAFTGNSYLSDRYLNADHAWGGGLDANYFFMRYLGLGVEGYALDADEVIGQASGNLIFRYPIRGTRFAPYGYAGGGVVFNGSRAEDLVDRGRNLGSVTRNSDVEGMGQFGAGLEFRFTPSIGIINDFSWNVVNGPRNNYGMVRAGVRFAF
jgi:hypothetical protein